MATNKYIIQLIVDTGSGQAKVKGVSKAFQDLDAQAQKAEGSLKKANQAMKKGAGSAGIAGAATAELGRTISDLPYGLTAVTNNISQLGSMFALLVSSAGSTRLAFKAMISTMLGPAGVLIAFQIVVAAVEVLARTMGKGKKALDDMVKAQASAATELKMFRDGLELQMYSLDDAQAMVAKLNEQYDGLNLKLGDNLQLTNDSAASLNRLVKAAEEAARAKAALTMVGKLYEQQIEQEIFLEKVRTDGFEGLEAAWQGFLSGLRMPFAPEFGKKLRVDALQAGLDKTNQTIKDIIATVGTEGIGAKIFGPNKESAEKAKKAFFPFLSDEELTELEENLKKVQEMRLDAERELIDETFTFEEEKLKDQLKEIKDSKVDQLELERQIQRQLYDLALRRLEEEKEREQENITDPETLKLIDDKYKILAEKAAITFRKGLEAAMAEPLTVKIKPAVTGKDLLDGGMSESQKIADDMLKEFATDSVDSFQDYVSSTASAKEITDDEWFLETFGFTKERFKKSADMIQQGLNAATELIDAQFERDLAIEQNKTTALNDQLRQRLRNEQLTAVERDKINQEIAKNEAALVEKQNEIEEKRFKLNKAQGIANAVINTAVGVSKVLPNIPLAAFIGALGAAQIATIASQKFVPQASPTPSLSAQSASAAESQGPAFNLIGTGGQSQLAQAVASQQRAPLKAYVVAGEVTTAQAMERNRVREASI